MVETLADAVEQSLNEYGTTALTQPQVFLKGIEDTLDPSTPELATLAAHCTGELLAPFVSATSTTEFSPESLQSAAVETVAYLNSRGVADGQATAVAGQLAAGLARHLRTRQDQPTAEEAVDTASMSQSTPSKSETTQPTPEKVITPEEEPLPQVADTPSSVKKGIPPIAVILGAIALVAILAALAFFVILPATAPTITFESGMETAGSMEDMRASGETITLPENSYIIDGYQFGGWATPDGQTFKPGDEVPSSQSQTYIAIWNPEVVFDGNGSDGGQPMESVYIEEGSPAKAPDSTFTRKGYVFSGWSTQKDASIATYHPGDDFKVTEPTTLYAIWIKGSPVIELSAQEIGKALDGEVDDWTPCNGNHCGLIITNDTGKPIKLEGTFTFTPQDGGENYEVSDYAFCLAAGQVTILAANYATPASKVSYHVTVSNPDTWNSPMDGKFGTEVRDLTEDGVTLAFKNTGTEKIDLSGILCVLVAPDGTRFIANSYIVESVAPNGTIEAKFSQSSLYTIGAQLDWEECDRSFFVRGAVTKH